MMSAKSSKFYPPTISSLPQKLKTKFHNLKFTSTMNPPKTSTSTTTSCSPTSLYASNGLTSLPVLLHLLQPSITTKWRQMRISLLHDSETISLLALSIPKSRSGRSMLWRVCIPTWSSAVQTRLQHTFLRHLARERKSERRPNIAPSPLLITSTPFSHYRGIEHIAISLPVHRRIGR